MCSPFTSTLLLSSDEIIARIKLFSVVVLFALLRTFITLRWYDLHCYFIFSQVFFFLPSFVRPEARFIFRNHITCVSISQLHRMVHAIWLYSIIFSASLNLLDFIKPFDLLLFSLWFRLNFSIVWVQCVRFIFHTISIWMSKYGFIRNICIYICFSVFVSFSISISFA